MGVYGRQWGLVAKIDLPMVLNINMSLSVNCGFLFIKKISHTRTGRKKLEIEDDPFVLTETKEKADKEEEEEAEE